ncbi:hypothetical protein [Roseofilum casamattae]|uniref:Uncharacterized protein n=1 Tax=Roseofilum casamattae BLCC-M143 TaxID=3022442 RepID=A0ABT7BT22_9CYAN|nr:hypothetical protein [Roseofilum casamattae]MDJ1181942.1 hypothetical protein [Roseofilum casamattae BLCC-M143]
MPQNYTNIDLAMAAMNHPKGDEILALVDRLVQKSAAFDSATNDSPVFTTVEVTTNSTDLSSDRVLNYTKLPRKIELWYQGVDLNDSQLLEVAAQYPQRLGTAISAWLRWANGTHVEYPTLSLIKAIERDWR